MTNALKHGSRPGARIWYGFRLYDDFLYVAIEDASAMVPIPRQATDQQETGRGLQLIEALAAEWGVSPGSGIGKRVWAKYRPGEPS
ncbi:ATP-binding protein [Kitasatospora sp. RB6PN24]|uniref:ATP-binding protein n=1 Tax=Kitasatospora humi TaxID=2893891 RepID=UPI001E446ED7|nr:ATP-binding protein [Kitasatospora humi]MCC9310428.1 ATP-binding protein [Kitasatospora humi]